MDALYAERDLCQAIVSHGRDYLVRVKGNRPDALTALADGFAGEELVEPEAESVEKSGCDEKRRIWTDWALADYIRDELGFPGARQGAMLEKEEGGHSHRGDEPGALVSADQPESPAVRRPKELLRGIRNHWSVENILHHVKDRSWDEDVHTLRRPGLGEVYASLVNTALNALRLEGRFPHRMSLPLRAKTCAFRPSQTIARLRGQTS